MSFRHLVSNVRKLQERAGMAPVEESNLYKMADEYQRHKNHHHFNKSRGDAAKAEFHRGEANKIAKRYKKAFDTTTKTYVHGVKHPDAIAHIHEAAPVTLAHGL